MFESKMKCVPTNDPKNRPFDANCRVDDCEQSDNGIRRLNKDFFKFDHARVFIL